MKGQRATAKVYVNVINGNIKITTPRGEQTLIENKKNISVSGVRLRAAEKVMRLIRSFREGRKSSQGTNRLLVQSKIQALIGRRG